MWSESVLRRAISQETGATFSTFSTSKLSLPSPPNEGFGKDWNWAIRLYYKSQQPEVGFRSVYLAVSQVRIIPILSTSVSSSISCYSREVRFSC